MAFMKKLTLILFIPVIAFSANKLDRFSYDRIPSSVNETDLMEHLQDQAIYGSKDDQKSFFFRHSRARKENISTALIPGESQVPFSEEN